MFKAEHLQEKWAPILEHNDIDNISDKYRKAVTSVLLENQEKFLKEEAGICLLYTSPSPRDVEE